MTKFLAFAASHREQSLNRLLIECVEKELKSLGAKVELVDYAALDMPVYNDAKREAGKVPAEAKKFRDRLQKIDGIIIASPEYNWSYPGSLKNIIDWVSHFSPNPFAGKTALLMSATPSKRGGMVGMQHLKVPLEALEVYVHPSLYALGEADRAFAKGGELNSTPKQKRLRSLLISYLAYTEALKKAAL